MADMIKYEDEEDDFDEDEDEDSDSEDSPDSTDFALGYASWGDDMRDEKRIDKILDKVKVLWKMVPDERFGQVVENYLLTNKNRGDGTSAELFFTEDPIYEKQLDKYIKFYKKKGMK